MFKWSDEFYDAVKYTAIRIIPAIEFLWGVIASVWKLPYGTEISATIGAVGVAIAIGIGMSVREYEKEKQEIISEG